MISRSRVKEVYCRGRDCCIHYVAHHGMRKIWPDHMNWAHGFLITTIQKLSYSVCIELSFPRSSSEVTPSQLLQNYGGHPGWRHDVSSKTLIPRPLFLLVYPPHLSLSLSLTHTHTHQFLLCPLQTPPPPYSIDMSVANQLYPINSNRIPYSGPGQPISMPNT
jgi:hypothetical protein